MKSFRVTYLNNATQRTNSVIVKARSIESARIEEEKAIEIFSRVNLDIRIESIIEI